MEDEEGGGRGAGGFARDEELQTAHLTRDKNNQQEQQFNANMLGIAHQMQTARQGHQKLWTSVQTWKRGPLRYGWP